jgi:hypothetical protein
MDVLRFCVPSSYAAKPVPVNTKAQRTVDYTIQTYKDYSSPIRDTVATLFLLFWVKHGIGLLVGLLVGC